VTVMRYDGANPVNGDTMLEALKLYIECQD
jgi:hypothetical protein